MLERPWRPSGPAGLEGVQCTAVRRLPEWTDHAGRGVVAGEAEADRPGYRCGYAGQYLPVWNVSTHPPGHQAGRGRENMSTMVHISRRGFLGSVFSAGALVLAAQVLPAKALGTPAAVE